MAGAVVAGPLDAVRVVAGSFDDPRVGPVPALGVEVLRAGDAGHDRGEDAFLVLRGKAAGSAARRRTMRTVGLNVTRSGSMPAAAAVIALIVVTRAITSPLPSPSRTGTSYPAIRT
jgi:hypothetical protein